VERPTQDRITVIGTVYHQPYGADAQAIEYRFSRLLDTSEQLYERRLVATEEWKPIDCGWIDQSSLIVIKNIEGKFLQKNPTEEERKEAEAKVLEVSFADTLSSDVWLIRPGEAFSGSPSNVKRLCIRCRKGAAKYILYLLPS